MVYGLNIDGSWYFCIPSRRFAPSWGDVKQRDAFETCLEEYLQSYEGSCGLPTEAEPWQFYSGESQEELVEGKGTLIVSLHRGNKEALWDLYKWCSGRCVGFEIRVDY